MQWSIDTGKYGAAGVDAANLRSVLEDALMHHEETMPAAAEREVMATINPGATKDDPKHIADKAKEAAAAKEAVLAKLPKVQEQMQAGIAAAEVLAKHLGGKVTASVTGHLISDHVGGIFKRIAVFVDRAAPTEGE